MEYYQINSTFPVTNVNHQYIVTTGRKKKGSQRLSIWKSGLGHSQPVSPNLSSFFLILFKSLFHLTLSALSFQAGSRRMHHGEGYYVLFWIWDTVQRHSFNFTCSHRIQFQSLVGKFSKSWYLGIKSLWKATLSLLCWEFIKSYNVSLQITWRL